MICQVIRIKGTLVLKTNVFLEAFVLLLVIGFGLPVRSQSWTIIPRGKERQEVLLVDGCGPANSENLLSKLMSKMPKSMRTDLDDVANFPPPRLGSCVRDTFESEIGEINLRVVRTRNLAASDHYLPALDDFVKAKEIFERIKVQSAKSKVPNSDLNWLFFPVGREYYLERASLYQHLGQKQNALSDLNSYLSGKGSVVPADLAQCALIYQKLNEPKKSAELLRNEQTKKAFMALKSQRKTSRAPSDLMQYLGPLSWSPTNYTIPGGEERPPESSSLGKEKKVYSLEHKGLLQKARSLATNWCNTEPFNAAAHMRLGCVLQRLGDCAAADSEISKAIRLQKRSKTPIFPDHDSVPSLSSMEMMYGRGFCRFAAGNYTAALEDLRLGRGMARLKGDDYFVLAKAEIANGLIADAKRDLNRAARVFFDEARIVRRDEALWLLSQLDNMGQ